MENREPEPQEFSRTVAPGSSPGTDNQSSEPTWHVPSGVDVTSAPTSDPAAAFPSSPGWATSITSAIATGAAQEVIQRARSRVQNHAGFFSVATIANKSRPLFDVPAKLVLDRLILASTGRALTFGPTSPPDLYGPLVGLHSAFIGQVLALRTRTVGHVRGTNIILNAMGGLISYCVLLTLLLFVGIFMASDGSVAILPLLSTVGYAIVPLAARMIIVAAFPFLGGILTVAVGTLTGVSLVRSIRSVAMDELRDPNGCCVALSLFSLFLFR